VLVDLRPFGKQSRVHASIKPRACKHTNTVTPLICTQELMGCRAARQPKTCSCYTHCHWKNTETRVNYCSMANLDAHGGVRTYAGMLVDSLYQIGMITLREETFATFPR
jgi:hypothetical protein